APGPLRRPARRQAPRLIGLTSAGTLMPNPPALKRKRGRLRPRLRFSFLRNSELVDQILPCRMNEMTSEYRVSDSTNASPMIIGTKSWLVLLGLRPIDSIAEAASLP